MDELIREADAISEQRTYIKLELEVSIQSFCYTSVIFINQFNSFPKHLSHLIFRVLQKQPKSWMSIAEQVQYKLQIFSRFELHFNKFKLVLSIYILEKYMFCSTHIFVMRKFIITDIYIHTYICTNYSLLLIIVNKNFTK